MCGDGAMGIRATGRKDEASVGLCLCVRVCVT